MPHRLKSLIKDYVMVVDDEVDDRMVTMLCLQHEGIMTVGATNGLDALKFLVEAAKQDKLPFVIFLDLNMPIMGGWELLSVLKMIPRLASIPIVLSTGEAIPDNDLYTVLRKPYTIEQLMETITKLKHDKVKLGSP